MRFANEAGSSANYSSRVFVLGLFGFCCYCWLWWVCFADEKPSMLYSTGFAICTLQEMVKPRKYSGRLVSKRSRGDVMNAGFLPELVEVEDCG